MQAYAIFAINEHIAELQAEAERRRLLADHERRPGRVRSLLAAPTALGSRNEPPRRLIACPKSK